MTHLKPIKTAGKELAFLPHAVMFKKFLMWGSIYSPLSELHNPFYLSFPPPSASDVDQA